MMKQSKRLQQLKVRNRKVKKTNLSYLVCNMRGYSSKKLSFNAILDSNNLNVVMMTETHLYGGKKPTHPNYTFVGRSRQKVNSKGGVAIGYLKEMGKHMVKVREGTGKNEFILLKYTGVTPNIIYGVYYGNQENTTPEGEIKNNLAELFSALNEYKQQGLNIIVGGDFNVHIGDAIEGNDPKVSKGGKILLDLCEDFGLDLANRMEKGLNHTHYDVSSSSSRILDLVITDLVESHKSFKVDNDRMYTPYTLRFRRDKEGVPAWQNVYTDHLSLVGEIQVDSVAERKSKLKQWRMNKPGGKDKFRELTDQRAEEAYQIIINSPDSDTMYKRLADLIDEIKMEAFYCLYS